MGVPVVRVSLYVCLPQVLRYEHLSGCVVLPGGWLSASHPFRERPLAAKRQERSGPRAPPRHRHPQSLPPPPPIPSGELMGCFCLSSPWSPFLLTHPLPACCLLPRLPAEWPFLSLPVPLCLPVQGPLLSPAPPARDAPTSFSFPPTAPQAMVTPAPDTLPVDTPSVASDVPPGARPSPLSPWGPWAGTGPTPASAPMESPLPGDPPPAPSSPQSTPGSTVPAPSALGPLATPEDLPASHPPPSEAAALPPALEEPGPEALPSTGPWDHPPGSAPATTFPGAAGSTKPALDWLMREGGELPEADEWTGGDMPAFSTSSLLSGDGDSAEHEGPPAPLILPSSLDYQYDSPGLWELVRPRPGRRPQGRGWGPTS